MDNQREVWERIAGSFDATRQRTWSHVDSFLQSLPSNSRVLDLMCGNGRHTAVANAHDLQTVSADWSGPLVAASHQRYGNGVIADATSLPFAVDSFDACIYVAGWHGIPSPDGRAASLQELHRVLKPGCTAQVTNWSRDAPRFRDQGTAGAPVDVIIPWRRDGHDEDRTYHLTTRNGFQQQCEAAGFAVLESYDVSIVANAPDVDNHVLVLRK